MVWEVTVKGPLPVVELPIHTLPSLSQTVKVLFILPSGTVSSWSHQVFASEWNCQDTVFLSCLHMPSYCYGIDYRATCVSSSIIYGYGMGVCI